MSNKQMNSPRQRALLCPSRPTPGPFPVLGLPVAAAIPEVLGKGGGGNSRALAVRSVSEGTAPKPTGRSPSDIHCQDSPRWGAGFPRLGVCEEKDQKGLSLPLSGDPSLYPQFHGPTSPLAGCCILGPELRGAHTDKLQHTRARACTHPHTHAHTPPQGFTQSPERPSTAALVSGLRLKQIAHPRRPHADAASLTPHSSAAVA